MPDTPQEQYIVTARKWRPQRFADVVGQEHVSRTLRNAVESKRIHHAYIFNGPRGVGKTTTARILAKAVNCENPGADFEPCNTCPSCVEINTGRSLDVIEIDGASNNSVDDIRKLRENAKYPPVKGEYKMYIIDEVHMLSTSAFNALLKTLEEPPRHLLFVFATTEPHKVPATILSRCQRFDFRRMQIDEIAAQLRHIATQEGIRIDDESLAIIGKKGDGSMRDSQSIFDQVIAFCGRDVEYSRVNEALNLIDTEFYFTLGRAIRQHDVATILGIAREVFMRGYDLQECLHGLAEHFRNILTVLATQSSTLIEASKLHREQYIAEAAHFTQADTLQFMTIIMNTEQALRFAPQPRLRFEFALVQMAKLDSAVQISELLAELAELKKKLEQGELSIGQVFAPTPQKIIPAQVPQERPQTVSNLGFEAETHSSISQQHNIAPSNNTSQPQANPFASEVEGKKIEGKSVENVGENPKNVENVGEKLGDPVETVGKPTPKRFVSAADLQQRWLQVLTDDETTDAAVKTYIQQPEMVRAGCNDGEIIFHCAMGFVADKLVEKQAQLRQILTAAFGNDVGVRVQGGSQDKTASLFSTEEPLNEFSPLFPTDFPLANGDSENKSSAAPSAQQQPKAELPDLDKMIVELFDAVAVPIRG